MTDELRRRGHDALQVDLPAGDDGAGLTAYTDAVVTAIGDAHRLVVVGQSMGGLTAPLVFTRVPVELLPCPVGCGTRADPLGNVRGGMGVGPPVAR